MTASTLHPISVSPGHLRQAAEHVEQATGLRVEIIGGALVMSPTPRGKHAGTVRRLRDQLAHLSGHGLIALEVVSMPLEGDADDYATPDLSVLPIEAEDSEEWLFDPRDFALTVEVISRSERTAGITDKIRWYALAGAPVLLQLDPRRGTWALYDTPVDNEYKAVRSGEYGQAVPLPEPLGTLETAGLPVYRQEK